MKKYKPGNFVAWAVLCLFFGWVVRLANAHPIAVFFAFFSWGQIGVMTLTNTRRAHPMAKRFLIRPFGFKDLGYSLLFFLMGLWAIYTYWYEDSLWVRIPMAGFFLLMAYLSGWAWVKCYKEYRTYRNRAPLYFTKPIGITKQGAEFAIVGTDGKFYTGDGKRELDFSDVITHGSVVLGRAGEELRKGDTVYIGGNGLFYRKMRDEAIGAAVEDMTDNARKRIMADVMRLSYHPYTFNIELPDFGMQGTDSTDGVSPDYDPSGMDGSE